MPAGRGASDSCRTTQATTRSHRSVMFRTSSCVEPRRSRLTARAGTTRALGSDMVTVPAIAPSSADGGAGKQSSSGGVTKQTRWLVWTRSEIGLSSLGSIVDRAVRCRRQGDCADKGSHDKAETQGQCSKGVCGSRAVQGRQTRDAEGDIQMRAAERRAVVRNLRRQASLRGQRQLDDKRVGTASEAIRADAISTSAANDDEATVKSDDGQRYMYRQQGRDRT